VLSFTVSCPLPLQLLPVLLDAETMFKQDHDSSLPPQSLSHKQPSPSTIEAAHLDTHFVQYLSYVLVGIGGGHNWLRSRFPRYSLARWAGRWEEPRGHDLSDLSYPQRCFIPCRDGFHRPRLGTHESFWHIIISPLSHRVCTWLLMGFFKSHTANMRKA